MKKQEFNKFRYLMTRFSPSIEAEAACSGRCPLRISVRAVTNLTKVSMVFLIPYRRIPGEYLELYQDRFLAHNFKFIIH